MNKEDLIIEMIKSMQEESRNFREEMNRRFEQVDKRFEQIDKRLERIEDNQDSEKIRLDKVYEARERVKITFGWQWGMASIFIAIVAVGISKIFT